MFFLTGFTIAGYVLLLAYFIMEIFLRKGRKARSLNPGKYDRMSTVLIITAYTASVIAMIIFNLTGFGRVEQAYFMGIVGIACMIAGLFLRLIAMRTLGALYTRTLLIDEKHHIIDSGIYRIIRHPGYLSTTMIWVGSGIAMRNWALTIAVAAVFFSVFTYRIQTEEAMLIDTFGNEYRSYMSRTWRMLPFLY